MDDTILLNNETKFYIADDKKSSLCNFSYLHSNGDAAFSGYLPAMQRLLVPGTAFRVEDYEGQIAIKGHVLKVNDKRLIDVTISSADQTAAITMEIDVVCFIEKCVFFEPG